MHISRDMFGFSSKMILVENETEDVSTGVAWVTAANPPTQKSENANVKHKFNPFHTDSYIWLSPHISSEALGLCASLSAE